MNEESFVRKLRRQWPLIGDDCAVIRPPSRSQDMLFTSDFSIEGVHFTRDSTAQEIGHKAVARSLSDIAAMGGFPWHCLISLALAPWVDQRWLDGFYRGVNSLLAQTKASIAGGDISHAKQLVCDVMVYATVPKGKALLRSGALPGDFIYVSGRLGGWRHKRVIEPRLELGQSLIGRASACIDISDGLSLDLHRLCFESGVAAEIDALPLLDGATYDQAFHDGEDYELLYTARPQKRVPGVEIGIITDGKPGFVRYRGKPLRPKGYDHFRNRTRSD